MFEPCKRAIHDGFVSVDPADNSWNYMYLVPETTSFKWMFGETTIFHVEIWNHPIETTNKRWLFRV